MIKKIQIENFKCHDRFNIVLDQGITTFVAPNGAGKSSLVEAVAWCIFGPKAVSASQDRLVSHGKDRCSASVTIDLKGEEHQFTRQYDKGSVEARVYVDGLPVADGSSGVQEYLDQRGLDLDGYSMIYARQGELSYFVNAIPSVRKQLISSLLGLDDLDGVISRVREDYRELDQKLLGSPVADDLGHIEGEIDKAVDELEEDAGWLDDLTDQRDLLRAEVDRLRGETSSFDGVELDSLREKKFNLMAELDRMREEYGKADTLAHSDYQYTEGTIGKIRDKMEELKQLRADLKEERVRQSVLVRGLDESIEQLRGSEHDKCPMCGQEIDNADDLLSHYMSQLEAHKQQKSVISDRIKEIESEMVSLEDSYKDANEAKVGYDAKIEAQEILVELGEEIKRAESELDDTTESLEDVKEILDLKAKEELRSAEHDLDDIRDRISTRKGMISAKEQKLTYLEQRREEIQKGLRTAQRARTKLSGLAGLKKHLPNFRDIILSQALSWVAGRSSDLLYSALGEEWDIIIDEDLSIFVGDMPLEDKSAGQIDMACVCLRIAIAEFMSKRIGFQGMLILDGVFDSIDEDNRDAIGKLVSQVSMPQVFILSHFPVPVIGGQEIRIR